MRLLYTASDGKLRWTNDIVRSEEIPPYAILSHTWGEQEVIFDDLKSLDNVKDVDAKKEAGWNKIRSCAQQAERDGLKHFWVDTCCTIQAHHRRQCSTKRVAYAAENGGRMYIAFQYRRINISILTQPESGTPYVVAERTLSQHDPAELCLIPFLSNMGSENRP
jgi:hypothetical protein